MISNDDVMQEIGRAVKTNRDIDILFKNRADEGVSTYRGGQLAGIVPVAKLGRFLNDFMTNMASTLNPLLNSWKKARKSKIKCVIAVRKILTKINECTVEGFGPYKKKKFAEFLILCGLGGVWGHWNESWLNILSDVWPFPSNSAKVAKKIFNGRLRKDLQRSAVVALLRCFRHHKYLSFPALIAQLCFWSEQENGRVDWM